EKTEETQPKVKAVTDQTTPSADVSQALSARVAELVEKNRQLEETLDSSITKRDQKISQLSDDNQTLADRNGELERAVADLETE
ncbi:hypothetical protein ACXYTC_23725, partial [Escherichia coli]